VTRILVAPAPAADLERLVVTHSLPAGTLARVRTSIEPLQTSPFSELRLLTGLGVGGCGGAC